MARAKSNHASRASLRATSNARAMRGQARADCRPEVFGEAPARLIQPKVRSTTQRLDNTMKPSKACDRLVAATTDLPNLEAAERGSRVAFQRYPPTQPVRTEQNYAHGVGLHVRHEGGDHPHSCTALPYRARSFDITPPETTRPTPAAPWSAIAEFDRPCRDCRRRRRHGRVPGRPARCRANRAPSRRPSDAAAA